MWRKLNPFETITFLIISNQKVNQLITANTSLQILTTLIKACYPVFLYQQLTIFLQGRNHPDRKGYNVTAATAKQLTL